MRPGDLEAARARARSVRDPFLRGIIERALVAAASEDLHAMVEVLFELEQPEVQLFGSVPSEGFHSEEPEELESPELVLRPIDEPVDLGLVLAVEDEQETDPFAIFDRD